MILGKAKKFKGTGCVCFLDVLGFSADILKNWDDPENNPLEKILSIKNEMPVLTDGIEDDGKEHARFYVCRVNTVSDSVTVCFGYNENPMVGDIVLGIEAVVGDIIHIWKSIIRHGYTIRGAIDFGKIYWDESELIGPAFINAYRLESEAAKNSRVILSSALNEVLRNLARHHQSPLNDHLFSRFRKDVDGYIILNPSVLYGDDAERDQLVSDLSHMRDSLPKGILREKYNPLIAMLTGEKVVLDQADVGHY